MSSKLGVSLLAAEHHQMHASSPLLASLEAAAAKQRELRAKNRKARCQLIAAMIFCLIFMVAEVVGGYFAHSLAIMTECVAAAASPLSTRRRRRCAPRGRRGSTRAPPLLAPPLPVPS